MRSFLLLLLSGCLSAGTVQYRKAFTGNGHVDAAAVAADPDGNVWVVTNTTAFDLPVKNAVQPYNPASSIIVSEDAGRTWSPLGYIPDIPFTGVRSPAVHPRDSNILVASGVYGVYRSIDAGQTWRVVIDLNRREDRVSIGYIDEIEFDPHHPSTVYAAATGGVLKSSDTGATWTLLTQGLAPGNCCTGAGIAVDPFQPGRVAYTVNERAYVSHNGGASWTALPVPDNALRPFVRFDPSLPGIWYLYSYEGLWRSITAGSTWTRLPIESRLFGHLVLDPSTPGLLYALTAEALLRSIDHGSTWNTITPPAAFTGITPPAGGVISLAVQPGNPNLLITSVSIGDSPSRYLAFQSGDAGQSWAPLNLARYIDGFRFDPQRPNRLYAVGAPTTKIHLMKFDASGELLYANYLGGQGADSANRIAIGPDGSVYIAGSTSSPDFSDNPARLYSGLLPDYFALKLDSSGRLQYASLFAGPRAYTGVTAIAPDASGVLHLTTSTELAGLGPNGDRFLYSTPVERELRQALTIAPDGDILVGSVSETGSGVLLRYSPSGILLSTTPLPVIPVKIHAKPDGHVAIAGTASTGTPRPIGPNAYQSFIDTDCPHNSGGLLPRPTLRPPYMTDLYITEIDPVTGAALAGSYLGGTCRDTLSDFAVSTAGELYLAGMTYSDPFPTLNAISGPPPPEQQKPFVAHLDPQASQLRQSTYLDFGLDPYIAIDTAGALYVLNTAASGSAELHRTQLLKLSPREPAPLQIRNVSAAFLGGNTPISPVEIVSVNVTGLEPAEQVHLGFKPGRPLPIEIGDVSVRFNGMPAPIIAVRSDEILCITPALLKGKSHAEVQVKQGGTFSNVFYAELRDVTPSFFVQVRNQDGSLNSPLNPAPVGSVVSFFLTGAGVPPSWIPDGAIVDGDPPSIALPLQMDFAGTRFPLPAAQAIPGFVLGLYEVRLRVPPSNGTLNVYVYQAEGVEPWYPYVFPRIPISVTSGTASSTQPPQ